MTEVPGSPCSVATVAAELSNPSMSYMSATMPVLMPVAPASGLSCHCQVVASGRVIAGGARHRGGQGRDRPGVCRRQGGTGRVLGCHGHRVHARGEPRIGDLVRRRAGHRRAGVQLAGRRDPGSGRLELEDRAAAVGGLVGEAVDELDQRRARRRVGANDRRRRRCR